jgi:hypothetical protein
LAGVVHLADVLAGFGAQRLAVQAGEAQFIELCIVGAFAAELGTQTGQFFSITAFGNPFCAQGRQAIADINLRRRVGVRPGTIVDINWRVFFTTKSSISIGLRNLAHRHLNVQARAFDINLAGIGQRLDCSLVDVGVGGEEFFGGVHCGSMLSFNE